MPAPGVTRPWFWFIILGIIVIIVSLIIWLINRQSGWEFWTFIIVGIVFLLMGILWWILERSKTSIPGEGFTGRDIDPETYQAFEKGYAVQKKSKPKTRCGRPVYTQPPAMVYGRQPSAAAISNRDAILDSQQAQQRLVMENRQAVNRQQARINNTNASAAQVAASDRIMEESQNNERRNLSNYQSNVRQQPRATPMVNQPVLVQRTTPTAVPTALPMRNVVVRQSVPSAAPMGGIVMRPTLPPRSQAAIGQQSATEQNYEQRLQIAENDELVARRTVSNASNVLERASQNVNTLRSNAPQLAGQGPFMSNF